MNNLITRMTSDVSMGVLFIAVVFFGMVAPLLRDNIAYGEAHEYPELEPYDVIHLDFVGEFRKYTLEPGRCQALVPHPDDLLMTRLLPFALAPG
jgi:hypothetical protein